MFLFAFYVYVEVPLRVIYLFSCPQHKKLHEFSRSFMILFKTVSVSQMWSSQNKHSVYAFAMVFIKWKKSLPATPPKANNQLKYCGILESRCIYLILIYLPNPSHKAEEGKFYSRYSNSNSMKIFHNVGFIFAHLHSLYVHVSFLLLIHKLTVTYMEVVYSVTITQKIYA